MHFALDIPRAEAMLSMSSGARGGWYRVQQMPQRKQGMGACSAMVISLPSDVLMIAFSVLVKISINSFIYLWLFYHINITKLTRSECQNYSRASSTCKNRYKGE